MSRFLRCLVFGLLFVLPGAESLVRGEPQKAGGDMRPADVPRKFEGQYEWRPGGSPYALTLQLDKVELRAGEIWFSGTHNYSSAGYEMKVTGVIHPKTRKVTILEFQPNRPEAVIEGAFQGTLSKDLQTIEAVWTSAGSGMQGDLKVRAVKVK
jgi:hypothetical protein